MDASAVSVYLRLVDQAALAACPHDERYSQQLTGPDTTSRPSKVTYIRTPPHGGSPEGTHTHGWDQLFFILEGTLCIELNGRTFDAPPNSLVIFPTEVAHKNWNAADVPSVHLAIDLASP